MSGSHPSVGGIVERFQRDAASDALLGDDELIVSGADVILVQTVGLADVAKPYRLADCVAEAAAGEIADLRAVAEDRLAAEKHDRGIIADEPAKAFPQEAVGLFLHGSPAEELRAALQFHPIPIPPRRDCRWA